MEGVGGWVGGGPNIDCLFRRFIYKYLFMNVFIYLFIIYLIILHTFKYCLICIFVITPTQKVVCSGKLALKIKCLIWHYMKRKMLGPNLI